MQDDEGRVADVKRQLVAMCGDGWEEEEWTPYIQQVVRFLIEEKEVSQKKVFAAVKGLIDYGVTTEAELKNVADTKLEFRSTLHAKGIPEAICDSLFVKYCAPGLTGSASKAQLEHIVELTVQRMQGRLLEDVSFSRSEQSHDEYVNIGKAFNDSSLDEDTWRDMLFPTRVPDLVAQTASKLLRSFQESLASHPIPSEKDLQEWCNKNLCSKKTSDAEDGMDWNPRSLLDTSTMGTSGRNKPDLTLTNHLGPSAYGIIAFIELKSGKESLAQRDIGQVMYAVQEELRRCSKLRTHMFAFLTNFKTSLLVKCKLDEHARVFAVKRAYQANTDEVFSALTALMLADDVTLDAPVTEIGNATVCRSLGRGNTSVVVAIIKEGQSSAESFVKIFRTKQEADSEFSMLQRLQGHQVLPFDEFERLDIQQNARQPLFTLIGSPVLERVELSSLLKTDWVTLLDTIGHLHAAGVVHRDIRPDNFLLRRPDTKVICLIDYGYAIGSTEQRS